MKVKVTTNMSDYSHYTGQIGEVMETTHNGTLHHVRMENGKVIRLWNKYYDGKAECEELTETEGPNWCIQGSYDFQKLCKRTKSEGEADRKGIYLSGDHSYYYYYPKDYSNLLGGSGAWTWYNDSPESKNIISVEELTEMIYPPKIGLPEKWCIRGGEELEKLITEEGSNSSWSGNSTIWKYIKIKDRWISLHESNSPYSPEDYTEITVEEYKSKSIKMKEIIGYKLKDGKYADAARAVVGSIGFAKTGSGWEDFLGKAKTNGVLDIWFEPIYKTQYKVGDMVTDDEGRNVYIFQREENGRMYVDGTDVPLEAKNRLATPAEIQAWKARTLHVEDRKPDITSNGVAYGCQAFTWEEIDSLIKILSKEGATYHFRVNSTDISLKLLKTLKSFKPCTTN